MSPRIFPRTASPPMCARALSPLREKPPSRVASDLRPALAFAGHGRPISPQRLASTRGVAAVVHRQLERPIDLQSTVVRFGSPGRAGRVVSPVRTAAGFTSPSVDADIALDQNEVVPLGVASPAGGGNGELGEVALQATMSPPCSANAVSPTGGLDRCSEHRHQDSAAPSAHS